MHDAAARVFRRSPRLAGHGEPSGMLTLYSRADDPRCHRVRIVLAEKGLEVRIVETDPAHPPEDLIDLNPYQTRPTLVDRELVVYEPGIICEYLDERFPHPSLASTE